MKAHKLVKDYEQQLARDPRSIIVRLKLAAALRELGQVKEALRQYRAVAELYHQEGRYLQALAVCRSALEIDPTDFETHTLHNVIDAARSGAPEEDQTQIAAEQPTARGSGMHRVVPAPPPRPPSGQEDDGLDRPEDWDVPTRPGAEKEKTDKVLRIEEQDIVEELPQEAERLIRAVLAQPSFRTIPESRRLLVSTRFQPMRLQSGASVLRQGEPGGGLYVIVSGSLRIRRKSAGQEFAVGMLGAGSFFADLSLVRGEPAAATVSAHGPTEIIYLPPRDFYDLCAQVPAVWEDLRRRAQAQSFLVGERLL